ncbi:MAG: AAA family ATPase [Candidatus Mycalebacterium zealandia]|nr:MAG: AAA family ATPase [Candidatus Mycalebacterium zealandia]
MVATKNIKISVENYGPIAEAKDIELCPLTVFVGPSNTGKSYLAILIYALLRSSRLGNVTPVFSERIFRRRMNLFDISDKKPANELVEFLKKLSGKDMENFSFLGLPENLQNWVKTEVSQQIAQSFHDEISRCVGTSTGKDPLISDEFSLSYQDTKKTFKIGSLSKNPDIEINTPSSQQKSPKLSKFSGLSGLLGDQFPVEVIAREFIYSIHRLIDDHSNEIEPYYLPAARTGIMQSHQAIVGALLKRATLAGLEPVSVPTLTGILSDFLYEIILMDTSNPLNQNIASVAAKMEENILHGSIKVEKSGANQYPQFFYKQSGLEVPLVRSSSMVSELAAIVLFIKHTIDKGNLLIIEEPESHLHPAAQREIASTIVQLIRVGVKVLVTTHNDYFLEQISNHVRLSQIGESERNNRTALFEQEIAAYSFGDKNEKGTIVQRLAFDQESGLSPKDHERVSSDLYNETAEILERTLNEK